MKDLKFPVIPSTPDERDFTMSLGAELSQDDFNLGDGAVLDQKSTSQCGGFTFKALMDPYFDVPLSPSYAYANRFDKNEHQGEGVMARDIMKDVYHDGICHIDYMPTHGTIEELKTAFQALPEEAHVDAQEHKIEAFYRLSSNPDSFLDIMRKTGLQVMLAIPLYRNTWVKAQETGIVFPPDDDDELIGGHAIRCCGQTDGKLRLVNTWGEDYPVGGVQLLHKDYPIWEVWMPVPEVPTEIVMNQDSGWYTINGEEHEMDTYPVTIEGRVLVPVRFFFESMLGTFVDWGNDTRTATIYRGGNKLLFKEGEGGFFSTYSASATEYDAGVVNMIDVNGRMLVPLRALMEYLGWSVHYNYDTRNITMRNY